MDTEYLEKEIRKVIRHQSAHIPVGELVLVHCGGIKITEGFATEKSFYVNVKVSYFIGKLSDKSPVYLDWLYKDQFPNGGSDDSVVSQVIGSILEFKDKYIPMMQSAFNSVSNARYFNK